MASLCPDVPGVTFKDIEGFPGYCIGDNKSVWSNHTQGPGINPGAWHMLSTPPGSDGYLVVTLFRLGKRKMFKLHVLMLTAFVGPCPPGMEACHYPDPSRDNCSLENLRWGTKLDNANDRRTHGTHPAGSKNPNAKLTESDVSEVRRLFALQENKKDKRTLASRFGVTPTMIRHIVNGENWAVVPNGEQS